MMQVFLRQHRAVFRKHFSLIARHISGFSHMEKMLRHTCRKVSLMPGRQIDRTKGNRDRVICHRHDGRRFLECRDRLVMMLIFMCGRYAAEEPYESEAYYQVAHRSSLLIKNSIRVKVVIIYGTASFSFAKAIARWASSGVNRLNR